MIHFSSKGKRQQTRRCVNSLRRGSKRTGLVTFFCFFFVTFLFLHEEESSIQMQYGFTFKVLGESSGLNTPVVSVNSVHSSNLCFQMALQNTRKKKNVFFSSYTAFPLRLTNTKKKWCVQSVMPKNYSGQINKTKQIKRKYSSSQMRYLCIALCQKRGIKN